MKTAQCPSCGAEIRFRAFSSIAAVCGFCRTTVVRQGKGIEVEAIGKMAEVTDDPSPIQLGTEGSYSNSAFTVIGRLRYEYAAGRWNEWHIHFKDGRTGWLSDAMGQYSLLLAKHFKTAIPAFESLQPGHAVKLGNDEFSVTDIQQPTVVGGDGELPFKVGEGYSAKVIDLQSESGRVATLDYSDSTPVTYVGDALEFAELKLTHLRDAEFDVEKQKVKSREYKCMGCGAPLTNRTGTPASIACGHCGTVTDFSQAETQIIAKIDAAHLEMNLKLPPGAKAKISAQNFEVVGAIQREVVGGGALSRWTEYLLYNMKEGYRFLVEYNGHWNLARVQQRVPKLTGSPQQTASAAGHSFKQYATYNAVTVSALGEFYWRVKVGDVDQITDYVVDEYVLTREKANKEVSWSFSEYQTPEQVQGMFAGAIKQKLPEPRGVYMNQPSPYKGQVKSHFLWFLLFAVVGLVVHLIFSAFAGTTIGRDQMTVTDKVQAKGKAFTFTKDGRKSIEVASPTSAAWLNADIVLVSPTTGVAARWDNINLSATSSDEDPPGTRATHTLGAPSVPAGEYYLVIEPEVQPNTAKMDLSTKVIQGGSPSFANYVILLLLLLVFPVVALIRAGSFETKRWADSDFAHDSSDDDE